MNLQNLIKNALIHGDGGFQVRMEREENRVLVRFSNAAPEGGVDPDRIFDRSGYEQRYSSDRALPYRETYLADRSEVASPLFRVLPCFLLLFHSIPEKRSPCRRLSSFSSTGRERLSHAALLLFCCKSGKMWV